MHFDLPMDLYEKRQHRDVLETEFLPEFDAGKVSVIGAAIYIEDRYLPDAGLRVALDQIARLYAETSASERLTICKSYREIQAARETGKIAFLMIRDGSGLVQCVAVKNEVGDAAFALCDHVPQESSLELVGTVRAD